MGGTNADRQAQARADHCLGGGDRPVGATLGQIGKLLGCRVVGLAGGAHKCAYAVEELGFVACIHHKAANFAEQLATASPQRIDVYFENGGGKHFDAVVPLLNANARIVLNGLVSQCNATWLPAGPDPMNWLPGQLPRRQILIQGIIILDGFGPRHPEVAGEYMAGSRQAR